MNLSFPVPSACPRILCGTSEAASISSILPSTGHDHHQLLERDTRPTAPDDQELRRHARWLATTKERRHYLPEPTVRFNPEKIGKDHYCGTSGDSSMSQHIWFSSQQLLDAKMPLTFPIASSSSSPPFILTCTFNQ